MGKQIINWIQGASTIIDVWPDTGSRIRGQFLDRSDADALYGDWKKVGNDIKQAIKQYEQEQKTAQ